MNKVLAAIVLVLGAIAVHAQDLPVTFSGAVSTYYSMSINNPPSQEQKFTTQPRRDRTIAVDLAVLTATWQTSHVRIRTAFQAGTWTEANYVGDDYGWRYIREVSAAFTIDSTWSLDAGISPSNIGHESSINAENMLLSRSLIADFTPYYLASAGATFHPSDDVLAALYVSNGWQKIVDNNRSLSLGSKFEYSFAPDSKISWNTYWGNDEDDDSTARHRIHNNFWFDHQLTDRLRMVLMADLGLLGRRSGEGMDAAAYGGIKLGYRLSRLFRIGGRVEYMHDPHNVLVVIANPFETFAGSLGLDVFPVDDIMVRFEGRGFVSSEAVHESSSGLRTDDAYFTVALVGQL